ncbi:MAG: peptidoglycan-binding protein [Oscillospiraceae bacterium]|nr:peptidoglycan-binding protein [Oscillospiraceae bacterium]
MAYTQYQRREHIRELQKMLHGLSRFDRNLPAVIPDGIYGRETAFAVKAFQQRNGLRPTGEASSATWEKIRSEYSRKILQQPAAVSAYPENTLNIGLNDEGLAVFMIQAMLKLLSLSFYNLRDVQVTGRYDSATQQAVKEFQKLSGQPQTGKTDVATWNLLVAAAKHDN